MVLELELKVELDLIVAAILNTFLRQNRFQTGPGRIKHQFETDECETGSRRFEIFKRHFITVFAGAVAVARGHPPKFHKIQNDHRKVI